MFLGSYRLWVMCYVLRITYARLPVVSISLFFTLRVASGAPYGVRRLSVDSGRRRGIVKQSGKQSVPQSVPQSVAVLLRQKGAVSRAVSRAVSLPMAGCGNPR